MKNDEQLIYYKSILNIASVNWISLVFFNKIWLQRKYTLAFEHGRKEIVVHAVVSIHNKHSVLLKHSPLEDHFLSPQNSIPYPRN